LAFVGGKVQRTCLGANFSPFSIIDHWWVFRFCYGLANGVSLPMMSLFVSAKHQRTTHAFRSSVFAGGKLRRSYLLEFFALL